MYQPNVKNYVVKLDGKFYATREPNEWCKQNVKGGTWSSFLSLEQGVMIYSFSFSRNEDAELFKAKWAN